MDLFRLFYQEAKATFFYVYQRPVKVVVGLTDEYMKKQSLYQNHINLACIDQSFVESKSSAGIDTVHIQYVTKYC